MEVVHKREEGIAVLKTQAKQAESAGDTALAEKIYLQIIKIHPHDQQAYHRLMILYRKQKAYAKELSLINRGIESFHKLYSPKTIHNKKVKGLSVKLNKAFGLVDKKGNTLHDQQPIATWKKRKLAVEKKLVK